MRALTVVGLLLAAPAWAVGLLEKNHPLVESGTKHYERGEFEAALKDFDAAVAERAEDPRVHYGRALSLYKLERSEEATSALQRAAELDREGTLRGKIHYALGNVAAAAHDEKLAIKEYRAALRSDPSDQQARHNLEVLMKKIRPPPKGGTPDAGSRQGGAPDGGRTDGGLSDGGLSDGGLSDGGLSDGGLSDGGRSDAGPSDTGPDGGAPDGGSGDRGPGDGGGPGERRSDAGQPGAPQPGDGGSDGGQRATDGGAASAPGPQLADGGLDVSRREAESLLDSLKNSEKNLQLWRFRQKDPKSSPHGNGKDW